MIGIFHGICAQGIFSYDSLSDTEVQLLYIVFSSLIIYLALHSSSGPVITLTWGRIAGPPPTSALSYLRSIIARRSHFVFLIDSRRIVSINAVRRCQ